MKIKAKLHFWLLLILIKLKWYRDRRQLPLTPECGELYTIIHMNYWKRLRYFPNLIECRDFNDRVQWLKLFDQDREIIRCSDKLLVRNYVEERVGSEYLVELYQVCNHFSEINFDSLPDSFVIKTNHDSGTVILVSNKSELNYSSIEKNIEESIAKKYGWNKGEWAYPYIQPKILVEEFILSTGICPADYKFHCVDGEVKWLQYIYDRCGCIKEVIISPDGSVANVHFDNNMEYSENFIMPLKFDQLKAIACRLSSGFKYVRIDLYYSNGKIYFGEMTFFPLSGCYLGEGQKKLGELLNFDRKTVKPFLLSNDVI